MSTNPINLAVRFILEMLSLLAFGFWGYSKLGWVGAALLPSIAAMVWGVFAVPNDSSRSGKAPILVSGLVRLILESLFFLSAVYTWHDLGYDYKWVFIISILIHYIFSYDRISWLLKTKP